MSGDRLIWNVHWSSFQATPVSKCPIRGGGGGGFHLLAHGLFLVEKYAHDMHLCTRTAQSRITGLSHFPQLCGYSDAHNFAGSFAVHLVVSFLNRKDFNDSDSIKIVLIRYKTYRLFLFKKKPRQTLRVVVPREVRRRKCTHYIEHKCYLILKCGNFVFRFRS